MLHSFTTENASLDLLSVADAGALFALVDGERAHLRQWLPWVDGNGVQSDSENFIRSTLGRQLAIRCCGELAGVTGIASFHDYARSAAIGYWLASQFVGRGLATAALRGLSDQLLSAHGLVRIEVRAVVSNQRSRSVAERAGFQLEGVLRAAERHHGTFYDAAVYSRINLPASDLRLEAGQ